MNRALIYAVVAATAIIMTSTQVDAAVINLTEGSASGYTMNNGNTYVVQNSVSFSNTTTGGSGMSVANNATVVLYVPAGITLTAIGANGNGSMGGGAGIRVPQTATLIITGEGSVHAIGGNAGDGGKGGDGTDGQARDASLSPGYGGSGGSGGGGAGAGIGGCGGSGGYYSGQAGQDGDAMGIVYVLGSMTVESSVGTSGRPGSWGSSGSFAYWRGDYATGGGGGGGGGAGSPPTSSIGGGGSGGGAGGSGQDGTNHGTSASHSAGEIGRGGKSETKDGGGGYGNNGGASGREGGAGTLYVSSVAIVNVDRTKLSATTHSAAQYTITFDVNGGQFSSPVESLTATLGCALPDCIPIPTKAWHGFQGWETVIGEKYYGILGTKCKSSYAMTNDVILYAQWCSTVLPDSSFWIRENAETGWFVDSGSGNEAVLRSGEIGNSTNSWMESSIIGPLSFSFDWKVSCNTRGHYLAWFIDGVEQARIRGETDWVSVAASVPDGEHVVRFDYVKGSTAATGEDKGQVRNFTMGLRVDTETMQVTWNWTTNYWVECSVVGKGTTSFEAQWIADGTNLVIPFSVNTSFYSLSLSGDADGAVVGDGSITVPITAPRSIVLNVVECTYSMALDSGLLQWMAGGAANWVPQCEVSHDGQDAVRSGEVTGDDVSTLSTVVVGPGTLSWWWKLDMIDCAGVDVFVDGAFVESLDSASDWTSASVDIVGDGEHIVRFEFWNAGTTATISDCAYLDQVSWTGGMVDHTVTTPEPIPYSYFDMNCPTLLAEYGGDYEATAFATALNGRNKVWECYVAGISPTNATAQFMAKIEVKNGAPIVTWEPDLNTNGIIRTYKVYGSETLEDGGDWQYPTNSLHRFFKVKVEMP